MNCHQIKSKLYLYLQNKLGDSETKLIEKHLSLCDFCSFEFLQWQQLENMLDVPQIEPPIDLTFNIMEQVKRISPSKKLVHFYNRIGKGLIAAGIVGLILNSWLIFYDLPIDNVFGYVETVGKKYFNIYDQVCLNIDDLTKGGKSK